MHRPEAVDGSDKGAVNDPVKREGILRRGSRARWNARSASALACSAASRAFFFCTRKNVWRAPLGVTAFPFQSVRFRAANTGNMDSQGIPSPLCFLASIS